MRNRGRTKLRFQPRTEGSDGFGPNPSAGGWGEGIEIGVLLKPSRGVEAESNGARIAEQSYTVEIRTLYVDSGPKINATWRAVDETRGLTYNISAVALVDADFRWTRVTLVLGDPP